MIGKSFKASDYIEDIQKQLEISIEIVLKDIPELSLKDKYLNILKSYKKPDDLPNKPQEEILNLSRQYFISVLWSQIRCIWELQPNEPFYNSMIVQCSSALYDLRMIEVEMIFRYMLVDTIRLREDKETE